jgi:hypothetical protein
LYPPNAERRTPNAGALVAANALGDGFAFDNAVVIKGNSYMHRPGAPL